MANKTIPAISVIIPMYNAEKYIDECLESLRVQTFQDFEVIVVDDCSTDKSCEIVESYIPKFGGRLKLLHTPKNSGGPGEPSNKGVNFSRGKYLYIIDNDDLIVRTALAEFYQLAENFSADAVLIDMALEFQRNSQKPFPEQSDLTIQTYMLANAPVVRTPTFDTENIAERVEKFCNYHYPAPTWRYFISRDLLIENDIKFLNVPGYTDVFWMLQVVCNAKKILHVPNLLYVYRVYNESVSHKSKTLEQHLSFDKRIKIMNFVENFLSSQKFFKDNPQYIWYILENLEQRELNQESTMLSKIPPHQVYQLRKQLSWQQKKFNDYENILSYLFTSSRLAKLKLLQAQQKILELENKLNQLQGG